MPVFDAPTQAKIDDLREIYDLGRGKVEAFELVKVYWPDDTGTIYYSVMQTDEIADPPPPVEPIEIRLKPDNHPNWFLPVQIDSSIGDEEVDLEMWDGDEVISQLLVDHGEGVKCELLYWFPQVELLLPVWHGHLRNEDEASVDTIKLKAAQGFRSADANVPGRAHWPNCQAIFGGVLDTQEEIDEHDCPYNKHLGGVTGINDPDTGEPWTFCDRQDTSSCTARGIDPAFHLSHRTISTTILNTQPGGGPRLQITSRGNETNLKEPVRVVMGTRRVYGMPVIASSVPTVAEEGWFYGLYEVCEGPIAAIRAAVITVAGITVSALAEHYNFGLGGKGQTNNWSDLTPHHYSGTAVIRYNFGGPDVGGEDINLDTRNGIDAASASAAATIDGLDNIRVYTDADTYTEEWSSNRVWQLARVLTDKRWGFGLDYARLDIDSWIEAAEWCEQAVTYTDPFDTDWVHVRSQSDVELVGKKVQEQVNDLCMAGRLSRPFYFNGKIHIVPLREMTGGELAAARVFTDEGDDRNIIWEDGKSTLTVSRKSSYNLVNQVKCTFDDQYNDYLERPLQPVEDIDAQLAAGRIQGDGARKINPKEYKLLGVVAEEQAIKMAWSLLDLGPFDEGGLQNNLRLKFKIWFMDSLDLHVEKVINVTSTRLTKYGFEYFRIKSMKRLPDLKVEIEAQAYNDTYMAAFEEDYVSPPPTLCSIDADCPAGYECINGICVRIPPPPPCDLGFAAGTTYYDGVLTIPPPPPC